VITVEYYLSLYVVETVYWNLPSAYGVVLLCKIDHVSTSELICIPGLVPEGGVTDKVSALTVDAPSIIQKLIFLV
jgi:hypothetical protein